MLRPMIDARHRWVFPDPMRLDSPAALKLTLSGRQPETCELLWQHVPLLPHRSYRFRFRHRTAGLPPTSGIRWHILDVASPHLAGDDWQTAELSFSSGDASLARLSLTSERPPGYARVEGSIWLANLALEMLP